MNRDSTRVAIACQGGGSHTAFTAGVLDRLLSDPALEREVDLVGLSGTSGGAVCALLAWYGREHPDLEPGELLSDYLSTARESRRSPCWRPELARVREAGPVGLVVRRDRRHLPSFATRDSC